MEQAAVAIGIYFPVQNMDVDKFAQVHERLSAIGQANPPGRTVHAGFNVGGEVKVFDIWDSPESFEAFGAHLMPILGELGIDAGEPLIGEIDRTIEP